VAEEELISSEVIGAISAVTAILISVGIVVLIVLKHKSSQVEREYKRIQIQMDLVSHKFTPSIFCLAKINHRLHLTTPTPQKN
jgi:hypothetical protein